MYRPRVGCYAVYEPPEEGWENWEVQHQAVCGDLVAQGLDVVVAPEAVMDPASTRRVAAFFREQGVAVLHALIITWSFDHYTVEIQQETGLPVAIRAIPGIRTGSLVGSQQLSCVLADTGKPHRLFYGAIGDTGVAEETAAFTRACGVRSRLQGARILVVGRRTEGMTPTAVDELEILRLFGTRLINYGLDEVQELAARIPTGDAEAVWQRWAAGAAQVVSKTEHGIATAHNYLALRQLAEELELDAISVGSYPQCQGTMCAPIAWLNEDGIPTGCEGDVNSTLCMLILSMLSEAPVHFGEMLDIDEAANTVVTSHCGCGSPSLASDDGYILHPVRLANDGVCIRFTSRTGPVTYCNLVGRKGNYRMCAFEGAAVPTGMVFEGNPLKFVLKTPFRDVWSHLAANSFGHHWMTCYGHVAPALEEFCKLTGLRGVFPDYG